jgi:hypothetical protein
MANPTTNYGFIMPTATDLVTDLPADFDVFGQAVDTQMLTNANAAIAKSIVDAKGDIIAATAADTVSRLAVGANDTVLTADSTAATGLKWSAPAAAGGMTVLASGSIANSATGFSITGIVGTYNNLQLVIRNSYSGSDINSRIRVNNDSSSIYNRNQVISYGGTITTAGGAGESSLLIDNYNSSKDPNSSVYVLNFWDYAGNAWKSGTITTFHEDRATGTNELLNEIFGITLTSAITRIDLITGSASTFAAAGTYTLYGVK